MKRGIQVKKVVITLHILIWSIILLLPYLVSDAASNYRMGAIPGPFFTISGVIHMGIFYIHALYIYPRLWNKQWWWLYFPAVLLLIGISFPLKYNIMTHWFPEMAKDYTVYRFVFAPSVGIYLISLVYCRITEKIRNEKIQSEKRAEQLNSELKFLRSQVSPHFLFNVLTNLVSLARKNPISWNPHLSCFPT